VLDWGANSQQLKYLTVSDKWAKEGLTIEVDGRIRSGRVTGALARLIGKRERRHIRALTTGQSS
jgi:hypothetical protein